MAEKKKVLLVGHCGPDAYAMRSALQRLAPEADFAFVNDDAGLTAEAAALLVNRVLDGRFSARSGLELIRALPEDVRSRAALISNLPEAQAEAREAGAGPGFGKSELYTEQARSAMLTLLGSGSEP